MHKLIAVIVLCLMQFILGCGGGGGGGGGTTPPANVPPVADAGPDQFAYDSSSILLTGTGTDSDGTIDAYQWVQTGGTTVSLNGAGTSTLSFTAPAATEPLDFRLTVTDNGGAQQSDTVTVYVSQTLFTDTFENASNWGIINDTSNTVLWSTVGGVLLQANTVFNSAYLESYHLGTYAYLDNLVFPERSSFRFSVDVTPRANNDGTREGNDIGILFPYIDTDNYFRLSMSSRYGYTRLEKREAGVFRTLGVNSIGYVDGQTLTITVEINSDTIIVWIDDDPDPIFAVVDPDIAPGTIALYCQDRASFDNVIIAENSPQPMIAVTSPLAHSMALPSGGGNTLSAQAVVLNKPIGGRVVFALDNGAQTDSTELGGLYSVQFPSMADGDHYVAAILIDADGEELSWDTNTVVGVGGGYYIAVGDSIINGIGDENQLNNDSSDGRVVSRQGFQAQLVDELTIATDLPQIVFNEGIGGDWSLQTDQDRIDSILERHPGASAMLLLIGTNDALSNRSDADFDGNLRNIVNTALIDVDRVYIARILPVLNSGSLNLGSTVNLAIADYNTRIEQLAANPSDNIYLGPDFFTLFSGDLSLYRDDLHPNDSGYGEMASAWVATIMN